mgnify:FL=1
MHDEIKAEFIAIFDADFLPEPGFLMRAIPFFQDKKAGPAREKTCTPCPCAHDLAAACHRVQPLTSQLSAPSSPSRLCRWASCRGLTLTLALPPSPTLTLALTLNQVGFVQGRWTYLNADESLFCRYQEICLNAHIKCEQYARFSTGNFFNFNGTGGVWRKACIDDAGGWNARTLVEDMARLTPPYTPLHPLHTLMRTSHTLGHSRTPSHTLSHPHTHPHIPSHTLTHPYTPSQDLSLRAFLKGWQFVWCYDMECPNEIPSDYKAYRKQPRR